MSFRSPNRFNVVHSFTLGFHSQACQADSAVSSSLPRANTYAADTSSRIDGVASFINATIVEPRTGIASRIFSYKASGVQSIQFSNCDKSAASSLWNIAVINPNQRIAVNLELSSGKQRSTISYSLKPEVSKSASKIEFLLDPNNCMGDDADIVVQYDGKRSYQLLK